MTESPFNAESASAVLSWIDRAIDDLGHGTEDLELALSAEVCAVICADSASSLSSWAQALVTRTRNISARAFDHLGECAFDLPGLLLLLAALAEQASCGEAAPPLMEYAKAAAATLCARPGAVELPGYLAPRLLLSRLGLTSEAGATESSLHPGLGRILLSQPARLTDGLARIETACRYGLDPVSGPPSLRRALGAILLCRLQDYDLDTACRVLRALIYLGEGEKTSLVTQGGHFLLAQQNEEGGFGFLETESASLASRLPGSRADLRFRLGMTTCAVWTLAEIYGNGYRLLRDFGRGLTGSRPALVA